MRVVAGALKGRPIRTLPGPDTRPTSDRARQAIFNILEHAPWSPGVNDRRALDLFAGSGAMGIEALSRGAASCLFVDSAEAACAVIRANLEALGLKPLAQLLRRDALLLGARPAGEPLYDLALLDPPYRSGFGVQALTQLVAEDWLRLGAVVVLETAAADPPVHIQDFEHLDQRRYGAACVSFLRRS